MSDYNFCTRKLLVHSPPVSVYMNIQKSKA